MRRPLSAAGRKIKLKNRRWLTNERGERERKMEREREMEREEERERKMETEEERQRKTEKGKGRVEKEKKVVRTRVISCTVCKESIKRFAKWITAALI